MNRILKDFISLFFPETCINCKRTLMATEEHLCLHCKLDLPLANFHKNKNNPLVQRLGSVKKLTAAYVYLHYNKEGVAQKLLRKLKYEGLEDVGFKLGLWMGHELKDDVEKVDLIIPVPLHKRRQKQRGYNQSDSICKGLSESLEIPWKNDVVIRNHYNDTQTKKSKINRWLDTEQLFKVEKIEAVSGKRIMIVDDVITTGATIESLALLISDAGAEDISVACLASGQ